MDLAVELSRADPALVAITAARQAVVSARALARAKGMAAVSYFLVTVAPRHGSETSRCPTTFWRRRADAIVSLESSCHSWVVSGRPESSLSVTLSPVGYYFGDDRGVRRVSRRDAWWRKLSVRRRGRADGPQGSTSDRRHQGRRRRPERGRGAGDRWHARCGARRARRACRRRRPRRCRVHVSSRRDFRSCTRDPAEA